MKTRSVAALCALLMMLAPGCKRLTRSATEKAIEEGTGAQKVDIDKGNVTVVGPQGQKTAVGDNVSLPDGWPSSRVPPYPGWKLTAGVSANGALSCVAETTDPPSKVLAFYKDKLGSGYKVDGVVSMAQMTTATFKSSAEDVVVIATQSPPNTTVQVSISTKK